MKRDGVLSSFHFNVFSDNMQIRSPYAPPPAPFKNQWVYYFDIGLDVIRYYSFIREFEKACNELRVCESYK